MILSKKIWINAVIWFKQQKTPQNSMIPLSDQLDLLWVTVPGITPLSRLRL